MALSFLILQNAEAFTNDFTNYLNQAAQQADFPATQAQENFLNSRVGQIIGVIVSFIGILFLGLTVYSGIQWMTAGGNEETVTKARKRVVNGAIGVGLTLCAFIIANFYFSYFESKLLTTPSTITTGPVGYQAADCQTNAQCQDRQVITPGAGIANPSNPNGPRVMFCFGGKCVECSGSCPAGFMCDSGSGLCLSAADECGNIASISQCVFRSDCIWEADPNGTGWEDGLCVDSSSYSTNCLPPQAPSAAPYCVYDSSHGGYLWVECANDNNCPGWLGFNSCNQVTHECVL